jgi:hypothetical protein
LNDRLRHFYVPDRCAVDAAGKSLFVELKINEFWVKILRDQDRYSVEAMLEALLPSLDWHPVSDRQLRSTRKGNRSPDTS